jgi:hypothetical protein
MKQAQLQWHRLRWPRELDVEHLVTMSALLATSGGAPVVVETVGRASGVEHRLGLPVARSRAIVEQLRHAVPGLGLHALEVRQPVNGSRAIELRLSTPLRSVRSQQTAAVSRALLTALALTRPGEELVLQWQLLTSLPPQSVGSTEHAEPSPMSVADVLMGRQGRLDSEARQALRVKRELPVWRALGRVAVRADSPAREQALLGEIVAALRLAEAPGVRLFARRCSAGRLDRVGRSWWAPLRLNTAELVAVAGWPVGMTAGLPVERSGSRLLPPSKAIPARGRVIANATFPGAERPLALSTSDGLRHVHLLGPTGTGKSTLLLNAIVKDVAAGRGVVVIEPKGDLISDVLHRIPDNRADDVILIDPSDEQRPVGLNPLAADHLAAELVADQLLGMFRSLYESSWGPRTNDILGASLLTLARTPGMSLCTLPALLANPQFRQRVVAGLDDPLGLEPFWAAYESWSEAERTAAVAPVMNKVRPFLLRPQLRAILGQSRPRFALRDVFAERKILLVDLAKGAIGGEAAALLGSLIVAQLWSAALHRTTVARERRAPVFIYIDEFQDYLRLPTDLGEALAQARSLGVGFVLAHQRLGQLNSSTRSALANARSRIYFQLAAEDARAVADGTLTAADFGELPTFEVYAQLVAGGAVQPWCSGRTLPAPPLISDPETVRAASRRQYGVDRRVVDAQLERLTGGGRNGDDDLTPRRRADRSAA